MEPHRYVALRTIAVSALKVERSHHGGGMARRARWRGKLREQLNFIRRDLASHGLLVRERLHGPRLSRLWRPPGVPMRHARLLEHELVLQRKSPLALDKGNQKTDRRSLGRNRSSAFPSSLGKRVSLSARRASRQARSATARTSSTAHLARSAVL